MPILKNPKHEVFAQEVAKGANFCVAYVSAGYRSVPSRASHLRRRPEVDARINELLLQGAERTVVTVQSVVEELAKIGFANMKDYLDIGPDGDAYIDMSRLTRDQAAAISEVIVNEAKGAKGVKGARDAKARGAKARGERKVKFKLHDKKAALVNLGNHLGMFKQQNDAAAPQFIERDKFDREV